MPANRLHGPAPLTHETRAGAEACDTRARARAARLAARDRRRALRPVERFLERQRQVVMEVGTALRRRPLLAARREDFRKQVAKARCGIGAATREVEPFEARRAALTAAAHGRPRVVLRPPLGIDQRLVGLENLAEAGFRRPVARIDVRVIPPGEASVGTLDLRLRRALLETENHIEIHAIFDL